MIDKPARESRTLERLGVVAFRGSQRCLRRLTLVERELQGGLRQRKVGERPLLSLDRQLRFGDQGLASIALLERTLAPATRLLRKLAKRAVPDAARARHRDAGKVAGKVVELRDHPGVEK